MLGKLIKYEFKSTSRIMWFLYAGLIVIAGLIGIVIRFGVMNGDMYSMGLFSYGASDEGNKFLQIALTSLAIIYVLLMYAVAIMTTVMIILRFYKNVLGEEGYLTHTLPVSTGSIIWSKFIVAVIWMLIALASAIVSAFVLGLTSGWLVEIIKQVSLSEIFDALRELFCFNVFLFLLYVVSTVFSGILMYYLSMAIGNLANKNKFLFAVLAYIGISIGLTIVLTIIGVTGGGLISVWLEDATFRSFIIPAIIFQFILGAGCYVGTHYILKNKLNLA